MKLSQPNYNHVRFDINLNLIGGKKMLKTHTEYTSYCGFEEAEEYSYMVGIKYRIIMFVDNPENEVVGYIGDVRSVVLNHSTQIKDLEALLFFVTDTFKTTQKYLAEKLPALNLSYLPKPGYLALSNALLEGLIQLGLYK